MKYGDPADEDTEVKDGEIEGTWAAMKQAGEDRDLDAFKDAFFKYISLCPDSNPKLLQGAFKESDFVYNLVAIKKDITNRQVVIDLQGNLNKEFVVTFQTSLKGRRSKVAAKDDRYPKSEEENMERLKNAGFVQESFVPYCTNCNQRGHGTRACPKERLPKDGPDAPTIKCVNCGEEGHRSRDCTEERRQRRNPNACRNCGQEGHESKECSAPRDASNVQCRKCEKMGHFSKDCPDAPKFNCRNCDQEGHRASECPEPKKSITCNNCGEEGHRRADCTQPRKIICNNCDEEGHVNRDCPKPKDPARIKCRNCDEMGHSARDCKKALDMSRVKCNECSEMGHFSKKCPNKGAADDDIFGATSGGGAGNDYGTTNMGSINTSKSMWEESTPASGGTGGGW
ncbi:hypothetical protein ABW20_dc0103805 [Dactylellina cionopaga]|nr:hypothetical protein ABW20_dc0103805 [Dactylellina cionopaga]